MQQTATNPQTGEKIVHFNGSWVPYERSATNPQTGEQAFLVNGQWQQSSSRPESAPDNNQRAEEYRQFLRNNPGYRPVNVDALDDASRLSALNTGFNRGLTVRYGDELAGRVSGAPGGAVRGAIATVSERDPAAFGREFRANQERVTERIRDQERANAHLYPGASGVGEAVGAVVGLGKLGGVITGGSRGAALAGRGALAGGVESAAAVSGNAQGGAEERARAISNNRGGIALGAAFGAAAPFVLGPLVEGGRRLLSRKPITTAQRDARNLIRRVLVRDQGSRNRAESLMRQLAQGKITTEELLLDPQNASLRAALADSGLENRRSALEFVSDQRNVALDRARETGARTLNPRGSDTVADVRQDVVDVRKLQASELYQEAFGVEIPSAVYDQRLRPILQEPAVRNGARRAQRLINSEIVKEMRDNPEQVAALRRTQQLIQNYADGAEVTLDVRALDYIARGISSQEGTLRRTAPDIARGLGGVRRTLRSEVRDIVPAYGEALDTFSSAAEVNDALEQASGFFNANYTAERVTAALEGMDDVQRDFYRLAVAEELENLFDRARDGTNANSFIRQEATRKKLRALFPDSQEAEAFIEVARQAEERFRLVRELSPLEGSRTAPMQQARSERDAIVGRPFVRGALETLSDVRGAPRRAFSAGLGREADQRSSNLSDELAAIFFDNRTQSLIDPEIQLSFQTRRPAIAEGQGALAIAAPTLEDQRN